jgi:hypothetical protein
VRLPGRGERRAGRLGGARDLKLLALASSIPSGNSYKDVLLEQVLNSAIVAGIAAVATWTGTTPDLLVIAKAFTLTFLIELRKYRDIKAAANVETITPQPQASA